MPTGTRSVEQRNAERRKNYYQTANAALGHTVWSAGETKRVLAHEISDRELSRQIGRSVAAIQMQRSRHKDKTA